MAKMKMTPELFREVLAAVDAIGGITTGASMLQRWNTLHASGFPTKRLYDAGLDDDHIDTALRLMARDREAAEIPEGYRLHWTADGKRVLIKIT